MVALSHCGAGACTAEVVAWVTGVAILVRVTHGDALSALFRTLVAGVGVADYLGTGGAIADIELRIFMINGKAKPAEVAHHENAVSHDEVHGVS